MNWKKKFCRRRNRPPNSRASKLNFDRFERLIRFEKKSHNLLFFKRAVMSKSLKSMMIKSSSNLLNVEYGINIETNRNRKIGRKRKRIEFLSLCFFFRLSNDNWKKNETKTEYYFIGNSSIEAQGIRKSEERLRYLQPVSQSI